MDDGESVCGREFENLIHARDGKHDAALHGDCSAHVADASSSGGDGDAVLMGKGEGLGNVLSVLGEDHDLGGGGKVPLVDGVGREVLLR